MGQKKVIKKTQDELLKESANLQEALEKKSIAASKAEISKKVQTGKVYINATYNNTILTATDKNGNIIAWISAGSVGFSGPKKATPFAASKMVGAISEKLKKSGLANIDVIIKGIGSGRDSAIKSLAAAGFNILSIKDATPIPHNGPKPPKLRRI